MEEIQKLLAAHPLYLMAFSALGGAALWHRALAWAETVGVDRAVAWFKTRQVLAAKRLGFSDAQIAAIVAEEAKAAQRAAQDFAQHEVAPAPAAQP